VAWLRRFRTGDLSSFAAVARSFGSRNGIIQYVQGGTARPRASGFQDWLLRLIYRRLYNVGGASDVVSMNAPVDLSHKSSHARLLIAGFTRPPSSARRPGVWRVLHYPCGIL